MYLKTTLMLIVASALSTASLFGQSWQQFRGADFGRTAEANVAAKWNECERQGASRRFVRLTFTHAYFPLG